ncbi:OLC1v1031823C1 [Oldenlandia corymbosa var. corymbosa]|uniref:OLC1v1031823C1 n=1 Tax=Oldenlandia corymbosa var. corymbosa TaxID=529605 RepID=A0AAV1CML8_OLDCO|nr:OLC1v1031823C1 [Oldenlandia corymbosa var. corymbosa]
MTPFSILVVLLMVLFIINNPISSTSAYPQTKHIFLLAGQSNMAGFGGVVNDTWDHVVPPECRRNPNILRLNPKLKWKVAKEPLNEGVDRWPNGIGPGMPFANALLQKIPNYGTIGLVPCSVSGTKIIDWQKGTDLYDMLVTRAQAAMKNENRNGSNNTIEALLWYQGESDTKNQTGAYAYKGRLQQFILDLRSDLNLPDLLVIQVALASGIIDYLEVIRQAQLHTDLPNVKCVDAMGLQLQPDNIHLSTCGEIALGNLLADAFINN